MCVCVCVLTRKCGFDLPPDPVLWRDSEEPGALEDEEEEGGLEEPLLALLLLLLLLD